MNGETEEPVNITAIVDDDVGSGNVTHHMVNDHVKERDLERNVGGGSGNKVVDHINGHDLGGDSAVNGRDKSRDYVNGRDVDSDVINAHDRSKKMITEEVVDKSVAGALFASLPSFASDFGQQQPIMNRYFVARDYEKIIAEKSFITGPPKQGRYEEILNVSLQPICSSIAWCFSSAKWDAANMPSVHK